VVLTLASTLALYAEEPAAFEVYQQFLKEFPDYPDRLGIDRRALTLARGLKRTAEVNDLEADIRRLSSK
jgi:hypothetical protein